MTDTRDLAPLFAPRSVAVVGASSNLHRFGGIPIRLLLEYGFEGAIYPINPNRSEIGGLKSFPDIAALPETPDLAVFCCPRESVRPAMRQCAERGVGAAVVMTSGFAEVGEEGAALQEEILRIARGSGMRLLGPNCMGVVHVRSRLMATFTISIREDAPLTPGPVAVVTQSGALGACLISDLQDNGAGISALVSLGNEADVDFAECIEYFLDDPHTRVICGYLESVRNGAGLRAAALRALEAGKPIVLLKAGATEAGARAAMSHTAALATPHAVFASFARQFGVHLCESYGDLMETVCFLARAAPVRGNRLAILSFSGGAASLAADAAVAAGFEIPPLSGETRAKLREELSEYAAVDNPVDLVSLMVSRPDSSPLREAGRAVFSDPAVDAVCLIMGVYHHVGEKVAGDIGALFRESPKPLACAWLAGPPGEIAALRRSGVPVFGDARRAIRGLGALLCAGEAAERALRTPPPLDTARRARAREMVAAAARSEEGMLPIETCGALLDLYGIPRPEDALVDSAEDALAAWRGFGGPVALKAVSPGLVHKTDAGGVAVGLNAEEEIRAAAERMRALVPGCRLLVQRMAPGGVELLAGISRDPAFGPCVTAGLGGVFVEVLGEVDRRLPPFPAEEAEEMLRGLRGGAVLEGVRGGAGVSVPAAAAALARLSEMAVELGEEVAEVDINPLIVTSAGALAVDVRIRAG
ncbi:MAG: acetate--CoA ligase family protein [bacterium]